MEFGAGLRFLVIGVVVGFLLGQVYTPRDVARGLGQLWSRLSPGVEQAGAVAGRETSKSDDLAEWVPEFKPDE